MSRLRDDEFEPGDVVTRRYGHCIGWGDDDRKRLDVIHFSAELALVLKTTLDWRNARVLVLQYADRQLTTFASNVEKAW